MKRTSAASYRIVGLAICGVLLFGCGGGYGGGSGGGSTLGNSDTALSTLSLSAGTLVPVFSPSVTSYTAIVPNGVDSIVVAATTSSNLASLTINGGTNTTVPLVVGDNTITIVVRVSDQYQRLTRTYTIVVTRQTMVIDTTAGWNGVQKAAPYGDGGAAEVFGQTFIVPADAPTLQRVSFWLQHSPDDTSGEDLFFSVVVMAWNKDRATGPVLYESVLQSITAAQSMMTEYLVNTGGLNLVPGQEYVAFLSANNGFWQAPSTRIDVGFQNADIYPQGAAWILNTDNDRNLVTSTAWMNPFGTADLVVKFSF